MRIGIGWWSFHLARESKKMDFDGYIDRVAQILEGIDSKGIELDLEDLFEARDKGKIQEVVKKLKQYNLKPAVHLGSLYLHPEKAVREKSLAHEIQGLELMSTIGADTGATHTHFQGRVTREGNIKIAREMCEKLASEASKYNIRVALENYELFKGEDIERIIKGDYDNLGLNNDTGNWLIVGEHPLTMCERFLPLTFHVHLKDFKFREGEWASAVYGEGVVDFPRILHLLRKAPDPLVALEIDITHGDEDKFLRKSVEYFKKLI